MKPLLAFLASVFGGALAGTAPMLIGSTVIALAFYSDHPSIYNALRLALLPLIFTIPIALLASIVILIPLTAYLSSTNNERQIIYIGVGAVSGFVLPLIIFGMGYTSSLVFALLGALSGATTGQLWWHFGRKPKDSSLGL